MLSIMLNFSPKIRLGMLKNVMLKKEVVFVDRGAKIFLDPAHRVP